MGRLTAVVVDDEELAREGLRAALESDGRIDVLGEAATGHEAQSTIRDTSPDVVFLDIEIPGGSGLEVARQVVRPTAGRRVPYIVFVTAWDHYAVQAFEVRALDYLVKPWDDGRLRSVIDRIEEDRRPDMGEQPEVMRELLQALNERTRGPSRLSRVTVREGEVVRFVEVDTIDTFESDGDHVVIRRGRTSHRIRSTLRSLEEALDPNRFVRVHRSTILNVDGVTELRLLPAGDYEALLYNGRRVRVSRHFRDRLLRPES